MRNITDAIKVATNKHLIINNKYIISFNFKSNFQNYMVGATGIEPLTLTVSRQWQRVILINRA